MQIAVIGCGGAIGNALLEIYATSYPNSTIYAFSRQKKVDSVYKKNIHWHAIDYTSEISIAACANKASIKGGLDLVFVTTGILHTDNIKPEKSLHDLSAESFNQLFQVNTIIPALIAKYFIPKLRADNKSVFAVLSARVGSISDNRMGGWYAYRASKAALNMIIKNLAIETARKKAKAIVVGLHPGTVDSSLSKPYQQNLPQGQLFTPQVAAVKLM